MFQFQSDIVGVPFDSGKFHILVTSFIDRVTDQLINSLNRILVQPSILDMEHPRNTHASAGSIY